MSAAIVSGGYECPTPGAAITTSGVECPGDTIAVLCNRFQIVEVDDRALVVSRFEGVQIVDRDVATIAITVECVP